MQIGSLNYDKLKCFIYVAGNSENFDSISQKFNVSLKLLKEQNCHIENVEAGDYLVIDRPLQNIVVVKPCDSLKTLAEDRSVSINEIKEKNNVSTLFYGQLIILN